MIPRIQRFLERNRGRLSRELTLRATTRAYRYPPVRAVVRPWFKPREPEVWAFLVGCYNSGTTVTQRIIGAHPDVRTLPREGVRFTSVLPQPEDLGWTRMWLGCPGHMEMPAGRHPEQVRRIVRDWAPWWPRGGRVFLEKSISNVTRMEWLEDNFPNSCFIGIHRNGYCAAEGIRRRARPVGKARRQLGASYTIGLAAAQWVAANEAMLASGGRVGRFLLVGYEKFVADPLSHLESIWSFLGLSVPRMVWDGRELSVDGQTFRLENMNPESLGRLGSSEYQEMNPVLGDMMARLGYDLEGFEE